MKRTWLRRQGKPPKGAKPDWKYRRWIARQPCLVEGYPGHVCWKPNGRCDPAHIGGPQGKFKKLGLDRGRLVPLCRRAHIEQEADETKFERRYQRVLADDAAQYDREYDRLAA